MKIYMKNSTKYFIALLMVGFLSACGINENTKKDTVTTGSGQLVSAKVIDDINASTMLQVVRGNIDANATNTFGYKAVKITYNTTGQNGEAVIASGLLVIPTATSEYQSYRVSQGEQPFTVSMLCDNHGTIFLNSDAPSNVEVSNGLPDYLPAVLMTGYAGFAGIYPDYIGFGDSHGTVHPYIMKKAATASLDMIKASMKYMRDNNIVINYQLYITGYSEGGYNAMALAQKVENSFSDRVNLMGVAPMAGPYNVEALANVELHASRTMPYPAFLADLAYSYGTYYHDLNISGITVPSEATLAMAFDGMHDTVPIHVILGLADTATGDYGFYTHKTNELFKDNFITEYQSTPHAPVHTHFIENNVDNWTPKSKMNLIQCVDDDIIPFSESNDTYAKFKDAGADVILTPIPTSYLPQQVDALHPFVHVNCAPVAYGVAVKWFSAIRQGDI